jgi:hypothetical protein
MQHARRRDTFATRDRLASSYATFQRVSEFNLKTSSWQHTSVEGRTTIGVKSSVGLKASECGTQACYVSSEFPVRGLQRAPRFLAPSSTVRGFLTVNTSLVSLLSALESSEIASDIASAHQQNGFLHQQDLPYGQRPFHCP